MAFGNTAGYNRVPAVRAAEIEVYADSTTIA